jgi:ABC-type branched-subunit amino acid transport system substrate-binding protein
VKRFKLVFAIVFLLLALVSIPLMSACKSTPAPAQTLKIGAVTSVTGPFAPGLKAVFDAAKPAADVFNQRGGITVNGQQYNIEIVVEDDKSSPPDAVAAANKLIQAGIKFIVCPVLPPNVHAMAPVCEEAKAIRVSGMQCDPGMFGPENRYHFDAVMTVYYISTYYDYLLKNYPQVKKVAILMPDDPGMDVPGIVTPQEAQKRGLEVVFQERYPNDTQDFYPIVTKALAQKPDVIDCIGGIAVWAAPMINSARELGFTGPIMATCGFGDTNLINSMLKPEYAYEFFNGNPDVLSDKMSPIVKELRPLVEATNTPFLFDSTLVLTASWIMLQGIEKAQSFDTDQVVAALESMTSVETPWGKGTWGGEDLGGINHMGKPENITISKIMNGKVEFEFVKRVD